MSAQVPAAVVDDVRRRLAGAAGELTPTGWRRRCAPAAHPSATPRCWRSTTCCGATCWVPVRSRTWCACPGSPTCSSTGPTRSGSTGAVAWSAPRCRSPTTTRCGGWPAPRRDRRPAAGRRDPARRRPARRRHPLPRRPGAGGAVRHRPVAAGAPRRVWTLPELVAAGALPDDGAVLLEEVVDARCAFLVTGGTGSGKTSVLSALLSLVDHGERIVLVEDASELRPDHPHVVALEGRPANIEGAGAVSLQTLVRQALRMRPDRLVVGEVRGAEVVDLLAALNTGHAGGCGTLHANSASDVPARVEALALAAGLPRDAAHSQLAAALDVVVHLGRGPDGRRRVLELAVPERSPTAWSRWCRRSGSTPTAWSVAPVRRSSRNGSARRGDGVGVCVGVGAAAGGCDRTAGASGATRAAAPDPTARPPAGAGLRSGLRRARAAGRPPATVRRCWRSVTRWPPSWPRADRPRGAVGGAGEVATPGRRGRGEPPGRRRARRAAAAGRERPGADDLQRVASAWQVATGRPRPGRRARADRGRSAGAGAAPGASSTPSSPRRGRPPGWWRACRSRCW